MNISGLAAESNKAIGASCRQTGRSLEECYSRNPEADKAQIFAGWREMQDYMAKNKLETMHPMSEAPPPASGDASGPADARADSPAQKKSSALSGKAAAAGAVAAPPAATKPVEVRKPLTNEEAEAMAKHDPLLDSILSTVRGEDKPKALEKKKDPQAGNDNRLLNILNEINSSQPEKGAPDKPASSH
ncbi:hypothetical protein [Vogesella sp. LIG4]|uniref:hypothetical protein n=1 Tax=Vogesella sp. LIG4 TaxID=1192162 RepID=UPI000B5AFBFE|nr:hypothetical protein [Vogesella sp. LIG4]